jgi:hypothetical protein
MVGAAERDNWNEEKREDRVILAYMKISRSAAGGAYTSASA